MKLFAISSVLRNGWVCIAGITYSTKTQNIQNTGGIYMENKCRLTDAMQVFEINNEKNKALKKKKAKETGNNFGYFELFSDTIEKLYMSDLSKTSLKVFLYLCKNCNGENGRIYKSNETIAKEMDYSVRSIEDAMKELKKAGFIVRFRRFNNSSVTYVIF